MGDAVEEAYRAHWARLVALLTAQFRDLDLAEETLQEAFAAAVSHWPAEGIPRNPAAWLLTTARRRAVDRLRRDATAARNLPLLVKEEEVLDVYQSDDASQIPDERLQLIFTCCHPAMAMESRIALTLRFVGGLTTAEIARLFLVSEPTMAARLGRAKKRLSAAGIPFGVPERHELGERRAGVLAVIYLVFTEGYAATSGDRLIREDLAGEAIRLGRLMAELMPGDSEVTALLALMVLHHARRAARLDSEGEIVLLAEQDRELWRWSEIDVGLSLLTGSASDIDRPGPYLLQAAIAGAHARARHAADTDWPTIAKLYARLEQVTGSAVVRLNRAVAVAHVSGPQAALDLLVGLEEELPRHHLLPATRADLLRRLGRRTEAIAEYDRALELVRTDAERTFLLARRTRC
ncbi:RNA polymerase sigma factor [Actinomadura sp. 3N407]|uniref:RNA polymerase sigma factor n=1 Tax=Actinomadura sp. 3N407 TaxID=3457423 RepID=UPI003FCE640C